MTDKLPLLAPTSCISSEIAISLLCMTILGTTNWYSSRYDYTVTLNNLVVVHSDGKMWRLPRVLLATGDLPSYKTYVVR